MPTCRAAKSAAHSRASTVIEHGKNEVLDDLGSYLWRNFFNFEVVRRAVEDRWLARARAWVSLPCGGLFSIQLGCRELMVFPQSIAPSIPCHRSTCSLDVLKNITSDVATRSLQITKGARPLTILNHSVRATV